MVISIGHPRGNRSSARLGYKSWHPAIASWQEYFMDRQFMCDEFDRISKLTDSNEVPARMSRLDQITWLVGYLRYKKDNSGFCSIFEEALGDGERAQLLLSGLKWLEADDIAALFARALELLRAKGKLAQGWYWEFDGELYDQIDAIGDELGDRMYELDDKLEPLLRQQAAERQRV